MINALRTIIRIDLEQKLSGNNTLAEFIHIRQLLAEIALEEELERPIRLGQPTLNKTQPKSTY